MVAVKVLWIMVLLLWYSSVLLAFVLSVRTFVLSVRVSDWQFSLRSLLITTTIVAFLLGLIAVLNQVPN